MATTLRAGECIGFTFLEETYLRHYGPVSFLNQILLTKPYFSREPYNADIGLFEQIGEGQCGTIWALTGTDQVLKVIEKNDLDQLWNDSKKHEGVKEAFMGATILLRNDIAMFSGSQT